MHPVKRGPPVAERVKTTTIRIQFDDLEKRLATNLQVDVRNFQLVVHVPLNLVTRVVRRLQQTGYDVGSPVVSSHLGCLAQRVSARRGWPA